MRWPPFRPEVDQGLSWPLGQITLILREISEIKFNTNDVTLADRKDGGEGHVLEFERMGKKIKWIRIFFLSIIRESRFKLEAVPFHRF
jgi:hypothetical protein